VMSVNGTKSCVVEFPGYIRGEGNPQRTGPSKGDVDSGGT